MQHTETSQSRANLMNLPMVPVTPGGRGPTPAGRVDAKSHVEPGTSLHTVVGYVIFFFASVLGLLVLTVLTYGIALIVMGISAAFYFLRVARARAQLRGSALELGPNQMPDVYQKVCDFSSRLGMRDVPHVYLAESNQQNAFALKVGSKHYIVLLDDLIHGSDLQGRNALDFIIAHELAHHALGHTGLIRAMVSKGYKRLGRLDEFSADRVAHALVGNREVAMVAMCLLLAGPHMAGRVNPSALREQADRVVADRHSKGAEKRLTHPLLMSRYARFAKV